MEIEENTLKEVVESAATSVAYIKLMKNTKGYNWEIKILSNDVADIERLNTEMLDKFGEQI